MQTKYKVGIGERFDRLVVVGYPVKTKTGKKVECLCDCGKKTMVRVCALPSGNTRSCGCLCREINRNQMSRMTKIHGLSGTPEYTTWRSMHRRCEPDFRENQYYYKRGISVCKEWHGHEGLVNFIKHVGPRPDGCSLDRIDNNSGYEPGNVRWADGQTQHKNKRPSLRIEKFTDDELLAEAKLRGLI